MEHPSIVSHLIVFSAAPLIANALSLPCILIKQVTVSTLPVLTLLVADCLSASLLAAPLYAFSAEHEVFDETTCNFFGLLDMAVSIWQVSIVTLIAFDRYIATIQPKWGSFRSKQTYIRAIIIACCVALLWSALPIIGFGRYTALFRGQVCTLDFTMGELASAKKTGNKTIDDMNSSQATGYVALLTATFLLFFLIPICVASSLYYSISDHVDQAAAAEAREDPTGPRSKLCTWAPTGHVAKVGLGCVIVSTVPYLAYAFICLNPSGATHGGPAFYMSPIIISRVGALLNPIFYVWLNPELFDIEEKILKKFRRRTPPPKSYQTINLIADLPCQTLPILTPTAPRRQLPQIPPHLVSPSNTPRNTLHIPNEHYPLLA